MAKTDEHMQKVRKSLMAKQATQARTEKVRSLRDQKKIAKRVQVNTKLLYLLHVITTKFIYLLVK